MVELEAISPFAGLDLPVETGGMRLSEHRIEKLWSVAPYHEQLNAVSQKLGGLKVGRAEGSAIWTGLDQWFVESDIPDLSGMAAVTDQADGWAMLDLEGEGWRAVLARLAGLDAERLETGQVARCELAHMMGLVIVREAGVRLVVMRSFAGTLHHETVQAMRSVAAQSTN